MTEILLRAPAKLTLSLRITGVRDDGFHLLDAEMVELDLADEIRLEESGHGLEVIDEVDWCGLPGTAAADEPPVPPGSSALSGPGSTNLVERALEFVGRRAGCQLHKRIPVGAGLGGGSADAAAILRWAGSFDLGAAVRLGADVPFCVVGGRARVGGIGEIVEPLEPEPGREFILLTPRLHVSTPVVYQAWDELGGPAGEMGNDLEPAALAAYPGLRWWRDLLGAATGQRPRLAGSGGTWFVEWGSTLDALPGSAARRSVADVVGQLRGEVVAGRESALVTVARSSVPHRGGPPRS
jgi:4-diphosphocytidyl-2-C-methyl-D-erythritol kinase